MDKEKIILQCKKEAKKQITYHTNERKRWESIMQTLHSQQEESDVINNLEFLYFSDEILAQDRIKRAGFWLRSKEAIKIMNELQSCYGISGLLPRKNKKEEPLMFAGLYIHYARWIGIEAENTAKLQIWEALQEHCIIMEYGKLKFGDIATIMGVII